jgi:hypothetical protein
MRKLDHNLLKELIATWWLKLQKEFSPISRLTIMVKRIFKQKIFLKKIITEQLERASLSQPIWLMLFIQTTPKSTKDNICQKFIKESLLRSMLTRDI